MTHTASQPTILTQSGTYFDFTDPENSEFTIEDIAHALAHICRFTGHPRFFYSVAQHSVLCSLICAPEHALVTLMHDAAEAFVGDVSRPLKALLPDYKVIETRVEEAIANRFLLPYPWPDEVKRVDAMMLRHEQRSLMGNHSTWNGSVTPDRPMPRIEFMTPAEAKEAFLERYEDLTAPPMPCKTLGDFPDGAELWVRATVLERAGRDVRLRFWAGDKTAETVWTDETVAAKEVARAY